MPQSIVRPQTGSDNDSSIGSDSQKSDPPLEPRKAGGARHRLSQRYSRWVERRYVRISLDAMGVDVTEALKRLVAILNKRDPGLGWEFGTRLGGPEARDFVVYREVEDEGEFEGQLHMLRELVGGGTYAHETDANGIAK